jgi:predicted lipid-binding transport protein (Tim44 family)
MGDGSEIFEILLLAAIVGFLMMRLWSVLGRRTGDEETRRAARWTPPSADVLPLAGPAAAPAAAPAAPAARASGIDALRAADRSFDSEAFLAGARGAFEIIVNSFAAGDTAALRPLLADDVYRSFAGAIAQRNATRERLQTHLLSIKSLEMVDGGVDGGEAHVAVKFVSDQTHVLYGADGSIIEGDPDRAEEKTDIWTFARPIRSRNPNWVLVATTNV